MSVMRIAVIGRSGQISRALAERASPIGVDVITLGRPAFDLTSAPDIDAQLAELLPQAIVNAAAYTAVDLAESHSSEAYQVNSSAAEAVASSAAKLGIPVIHLSTDYVFDGRREASYRECDEPEPISVYGHSKLQGEQRVAAATPNHMILRTAWVYGPHGQNFVRTMLALATKREEIAVVDDQWGSPSNALDIADAIFSISREMISNPELTDLRGIFHMTGDGTTNWAEFAKAIFVISERLGGPSARVMPVTTSQFPRPAPRPANSRLDNSKMARLYGIRLPHWQDSLPKVVARILAKT